MNSENYYSLLLKKQPLAQWRAIRNVLLEEYKIKQGDFELLMELYEIEHFTTEDFINGSTLLNWDKARWNRLKDDNWIEMYRERQGGSNHRYNIYRLSRRARNMVRKAYAIIAGKEPLPTKLISKRSQYKHKILDNRAKDINNGRKSER